MTTAGGEFQGCGHAARIDPAARIDQAGRPPGENQPARNLAAVVGGSSG